ncbi:MAG: hypothetical protein ACRDWH_05835 [Acidimicrobiia bacterium]
MRPRFPLTYDRAKTLLLVSGLILIGVVGLAALSRGVDLVEVAGTLMFIPVFVGFIFFGVPGGLALGIAAATAYVALRWPAIQLVGLRPLSWQLVARVIGYVGFGVGGGWAIGQIRTSLDKLELHDEIDDETGLGNARSMIETVDVERARADRYQKLFSVVAADFKATMWEEMSNRRKRSALRDLGTKLAAGVRSSDHVAHARRAGHHVIGVVLPETAEAGARIVADNLQRQLNELTGSEQTRVVMATHPSESDALVRIIDLFREIDRSQRPAPD